MKLLFSTLLLLLAQVRKDVASIDGIVTKLKSEQRVASARILLIRVNGQLPDAITATADRQGQFTIPNIPPGAYRLFVTHPEYVRTEKGQSSINGHGLPL